MFCEATAPFPYEIPIRCHRERYCISSRLFANFYEQVTGLECGLDAKRPDNKGADQSALPRSLFSAFVIHYIESIVVVKRAKF